MESQRNLEPYLSRRKKLMEQAIVGEFDPEGTSLTEEELMDLIL